MRRDVSEKPRSAKSSSAASSMRSTVSDCAILLSMPLTNVCLKHTFDTLPCQAYLGMTATVQEIRDVYRYRSGGGHHCGSHQGTGAEHTGSALSGSQGAECNHRASVAINGTCLTVNRQG